MTMAPTPAAPVTRMNAGGRATEAGMAFQSEVATWLAVHILVCLPVGGRFGINNQALPVGIRLETGSALDDIEVMQSDDGRLHFQCKTKANLGAGGESPLAKTLGQAAKWVATEKAAEGLPDVTSNAAVLAVRADSPMTLDVLEAGCRAFDSGGSWAVTRGERNQAERAALGLLEAAVNPAWIAIRGTEPQDADLVDLARIFHVARFAMDEGDRDWREASQLLGRHLYGGDAEGEAPLRDLKGIVRGLISSGAPANRAGLLRALRQRGHNDIMTPGFDADIASLRAATSNELARLSMHGVLPLGAGIPIARECSELLVKAIRDGSLLVIGEPGAGKTGALVHAAATLAAAGDTVVFLSVDRFPGVAIAADLDSELGLGHRLPDTLGAMPGAGRRILFIDALDAARGGHAEGVFAMLIEQVLTRFMGEWIVVASIRTFDLKNGRRFRQAFAGTPTVVAPAEQGLAGVRHFTVPRLSDADLETASTASPALAGLLASAPPRLIELLRNVFNLSLAAQLLANGTDPSTFAEIGTQSGLIDAYENERLNAMPLRRAAREAAAAMVRSRRLSVRKIAVEHDDLDAVIGTGVLAEAGELVSFAHHVLFDHVVGRFYLAWDDPDALRAQVACDTSTALMLAPALRFAVERLWRDDGAGRPRIWRLIESMFAGGVDPVLSNVALRTIVENVQEKGDLAGLMARIASTPGDAALAIELRRLTRFASMNIAEHHVLAAPAAQSWARLAAALVATRERLHVDPARMLLKALFDHADLADVALLEVLGHTARALLELVWTASAQLTQLAPMAIEFIGKSFGSAPAASRDLLDRILREPHFSQNADREARWLATQIKPITRVDPDFTVQIYAALYGKTITDTTTSAMGSDRILRLTSTRRQDYESSLHLLAAAIGDVLALSPYHGTRALVDALVGQHIVRGGANVSDAGRIHLGAASISLRGASYEYNDWHQAGTSRRTGDLLHYFVVFLRGCDTEAFAACVEAASSGYATASVWARIIGVGAERIADVGEMLWPLFERPDLIELLGTRRDAVRFVAAAWPSRSTEEHSRFETMLLDESRFTGGDDLARWHAILDSILAAIPEDALRSEGLRELRRAFDISFSPIGDMTGFSISVTPVDYEARTRDHLLSAGVDIVSGPDRQVLDAAEALNTMVKQTPAGCATPQLAKLWNQALALLALLDASPSIHERSSHAAWGYVANAVERVASDANYTPGLDGAPELAAMFSTLDRLSSSPYPHAAEEASPMVWGGWDVRVDAAQAWMYLSERHAAEHPLILDRLQAVLEDAVPAVRLQAARNLAVVGNSAPEQMWAMAVRLVGLENNAEVLASLLHSIRPYSHAAPERCETLLTVAATRWGDGAIDDKSATSELCEQLGAWTAQLFVGQARDRARDWLAQWAIDPLRFNIQLTAFVDALRGPLFARYEPDPAVQTSAMSGRAQQAIELVLSSANRISADAQAVAGSDTYPDADRQQAVERYRAAETVILHSISQFYYGSGALGERRVDEGPGLRNADSMARFLTDYSGVLGMLADSRNPEALHHLIELYEFLIPGDPPGVFEALHAILVGQGEQQGYHYETLAIGVIVGIVRRYLADYLPIFEGELHRTNLVAILGLFADAGWPEALQLLYDLPDLLR